MSECAEDLQHKPCATADLCRPCHARANAQRDTQHNDQRFYAIECIQAPMQLEYHNDRDCHSNCGMSTCTQDYLKRAVLMVDNT